LTTVIAITATAAIASACGTPAQIDASTPESLLGVALTRHTNPAATTLAMFKTLVEKCLAWLDLASTETRFEFLRRQTDRDLLHLLDRGDAVLFRKAIDQARQPAGQPLHRVLT
jgi:hypothetical protein